MPKGDNRVLKAQKTTFSSGHRLCHILFLSVGELGICLQNLISIGGVEHRQKNYFPQGGMLNFTYKGRFLFENKKGIQKIVVLKIQTKKTCFGASSIYIGFFFEKN
jgi:hypothetical protein